MAIKKKLSKGQRGAKKKAETIEKRQSAQKTKLLEYLEEAPNIGAALSRIGINRSTYSRWRADDEVFTIEADEAIGRGIEKTADNVELALLGKARDGSVQAQKYYLSNNHKRYRENNKGLSESESVLTEEMMKQMANAAGIDHVIEEEDERNEDYESEHDLSEEEKD
ncbi:hypothetical protein HYV70_05325 [Candidatus Uhrbacteria bacterium]|nr:hypothetical protein [Candidatus Uhrbacteria bacterium]